MPPDTTSRPPALPAGRRWLVRGLLVVATAIAVVAVFAVWANRQVLDADNWAETSTALLQDEAVKSQVSAYLVDEVYTQVDVAGEVAAALPTRLDPLAGPAASGLRQFAENRTERLLGRPRVQQAWETANRVTAQQFIDIAEGESEAVTISGNAVVLNLRVMVTDLVQRLGGSGKLVGKVPPDAGRITIMTSDQVSTLQNAVTAVRGLSAVLPFLSIALFALAVFLARGRRRRTLMYAGFGFIVAGMIVLVGRNVAGDYVVSELTTTAGAEPAAEAVWSIGSGMLRDVAQATVIMGIPVVAAAWLAGPTRSAFALRRAAAPWLRTRPDIAYGVLAAVLLLIVAWGPLPATRMVVPVLLMTALAVAGMAVLRRQVEEEFPDAVPGAAGSSLRAGAARAVSAVRPSPPTPTTAEEPTMAQTTQASRLEQLERLAGLHERGELSDDEYVAAKRLVMREVAAR